MALYEFEGSKPTVAEDAYVAETADVIGDVKIGAKCFIGPGARVKGDYGTIVIGEGSSVQENCVIHARPGEACAVGRGCTIGHGAILHNCTIQDGAVVGMGAIVSDWAIVGNDSVVGEGAVVRQSAVIPPNKIAVGVPARVVGDIDDKTREFQRLAREVYKALPARYRTGLKRID
jgi:phenylacetic acid degradation protein